MTETERRMAYAMLLGAGHTPHNARWMAASCPSIERCKELCREDARRTIDHHECVAFDPALVEQLRAVGVIR